jgi:hypothetical protein
LSLVCGTKGEGAWLWGRFEPSYLLNDSGIVGSRTETGGRDETAAPEHG